MPQRRNTSTATAIHIRHIHDREFPVSFFQSFVYCFFALTQTKFPVLGGALSEVCFRIVDM
jgi:hypothetical protein